MNEVNFSAPDRASARDWYQYRLEIEGLRAVAVLAVVIFHIGLALSGGYIGVDVFFVISGFLITRNILKDQESGIFTFKRFYIRRICRLLPALVVTLLLSLVAGFALLAPADMARLGRTALFSMISVSNIVFWRESGYFEPAAALNPLLHTWSLSVEEQFYLIWPATIVLAYKFGRSRGVAAIVILIGGISFVSAELFRTDSSGAVFYLMPFRMFELCAGATLTFIPWRWHPKPFWAHFALLAGIFIVAYSAVNYGSSPSPSGLWSLQPCIGAALVIYAGNPPWSGKLLSNRLVTAVGRISYSLYLVHWPIIVFYRYLNGPTIPLHDQLVLLALCLVTATLMYRMVELPFRRGMISSASIRTSKAAITLAAVPLACSAIAAHAYYSDGWVFRVSSELQRIPSESVMWNERNPAARVGSCFLYERTRSDLDENLCLKLDPRKPNYLIVGDSFAADAYVYLSAAYPGVNFLQATAGNCYPLMEQSADKLCATMLRVVFGKFIPTTKLDGVVLSAAWTGQDFDLLEKTIDVLRSQTPRVVLIGSGVRFPTSPSTLIFQSKFQSTFLSIDVIERDVDSHIDPVWSHRNDIARHRFQTKVAAYIDVQSIMCEDHCRLFTPQGQMIYIDFGHLTLAGSRYLAPRISARYGNPFPISLRALN
ncbi:MAG: acyltransferase family protein [Burkholderiaceae bacterium]|nr:acyltransferase family protein [Burkholderiaceae bacterium]